MQSHLTAIANRTSAFRGLVNADEPLQFVALESQIVKRKTAWAVFGPDQAVVAKMERIYGQADYLATAICFAGFQETFIDGQLGVCKPRDRAVITESAYIANMINPGLTKIPFLTGGEFVAEEIEQPLLHVFHRASPAYGHFIFDCLAILLLLKNEILSSDIKILVPAYFPAWGIQILKYTGFPDTKIVVPTKDVILCSNVVVPNTITSANTFSPHPAAMLALRQLSKKVRPQTKIYLTRRGQVNYSERLIENEDQVIEYLIAQGFQIVEPGNLPFEEQLTVVGDAKIIISAHGSALANIAFAQKGATLIDLMPQDWIGLFPSPQMNAERWAFQLTCLFELHYLVVLTESRKEPTEGGGSPRLVSAVDLGVLEKALQRAEGRPKGWLGKLVGLSRNAGCSNEWHKGGAFRRLAPRATDLFAKTVNHTVFRVDVSKIKAIIPLVQQVR